MEEYMSPEDKQALIEIMGPLYGQAKLMDNSWYEDSKAKVGGMPDQGAAGEIKRALERELTRPTYVPTHNSYIQHPQPSQTPVEYYQAPSVTPIVTHQHHSQPIDNSQMEFSFDQTEQQKTNNLLEEISRKLTKMISLLQENQKKENVTKLKVTKLEG